jgi:hypothetical protein
MHARRSLIALAAAALCSAALAQVPTLGAKIAGLAGGGVYSTLNPADSAAGFTFSNGNLTWSNSTNTQVTRSTTSKTTGKWYFETRVDNVTGSLRTGIANSSLSLSGSFGLDANGVAVLSTGQLAFNYSTLCNFSAVSAGDIIGVAFDVPNSLIYFSVNGTWQCSGNPSAGSGGYSISMTGPYFATNATGTVSGARGATVNFGKTAFSYSIPTGFSAWH